MSIMDDYFDVSTKLKGEPEHEIFEKFSKWAFDNEKELEALIKQNKELKMYISGPKINNIDIERQ